MIPFHPISLADRPLVDAVYRAAGTWRASHAFSTLYMWRDYLRLTIGGGEDWYAVRMGTDALFFPSGPMVARYKCVWHALETGMRLRYLTDEDRVFLEAAFPDRFILRPDPDATEYIYSVQEQADLQGERFSAVRARLEAMLAEGNRWVVETISPTNIHRLRPIVEDWYGRRMAGGEARFGSVTAVLDMLDAYAALDLFGILLLRDGRPMAFGFGSALSEDVFGLHAACFLGEDMRVMEFCLHQLCQLLRAWYTRINAEEDMGAGTLRAYRQEHRPIERIDMWLAEPA